MQQGKNYKVMIMEMIVNLKEHSYPIYIEKHILDKANDKKKKSLKERK